MILWLKEVNFCFNVYTVGRCRSEGGVGWEGSCFKFSINVSKVWEFFFTCPVSDWLWVVTASDGDGRSALSLSEELHQTFWSSSISSPLLSTYLYPSGSTSNSFVARLLLWLWRIVFNMPAFMNHSVFPPGARQTRHSSTRLGLTVHRAVARSLARSRPFARSEWKLCFLGKGYE